MIMYMICEYLCIKIYIERIQSKYMYTSIFGIMKKNYYVRVLCIRAHI